MYNALNILNLTASTSNGCPVWRPFSRVYGSLLNTHDPLDDPGTLSSLIPIALLATLLTPQAATWADLPADSRPGWKGCWTRWMTPGCGVSATGSCVLKAGRAGRAGRASRTEGRRSG